MRSPVGGFEQLLLLALLRVGADASSLAIRDDFERRTGRSPSPGAIYTALARLERRGFVASHLGEPTPQRGGKRKRYYRLLTPGKRALLASQDAFRRMAHGLAPRLDLP